MDVWSQHLNLHPSDALVLVVKLNIQIWYFCLKLCYFVDSQCLKLNQIYKMAMFC